MARFPDVVRASPERVWQALLSTEPVLEAKVALEARREGDAFVYVHKGGTWQENVLEAEAPRRLVLERREGESATARLEWTLQPIDLGTLLVLAVTGTNFKEGLRQNALLARSYRRRIRAIKRRVEPPLPSRLNPPAAAPSEPAAASAPIEPTPAVATPEPEPEAARRRGRASRRKK